MVQLLLLWLAQVQTLLRNEQEEKEEKEKEEWRKVSIDESFLLPGLESTLLSSASSSQEQRQELVVIRQVFLLLLPSSLA